MRLPSNSLKDLISFYHSELQFTYDYSEIEAIINLVLEHYLGFSKTDILKKKQENINQSDLLKLYFCCKDLKKNIPVQYILQEAWFYNLKFYVDKHVLIPRPETEELVDYILKENKNAKTYLDVGTGSGCIPVTIKKNNPSSSVYACDISTDALALAKKNAALNETEISFFLADALNTEQLLQKTETNFDVIISNPPYIKYSEKELMTPSVLDNEPHLALFVEGDDTIIFYKKIIDLCKYKLNNNGKLYFEVNPLTADNVKEYSLKSKLFKKVELLKDLSGKVRFLSAEKH